MALSRLTSVALVSLLSFQVSAVPQAPTAADPPESTATAISLSKIGNNVNPVELKLTVPMLPTEPKDVELISEGIDFSLPIDLEQLHVPATDVTNKADEGAAPINDVPLTMLSGKDVKTGGDQGAGCDDDNDDQFSSLARRGLGPKFGQGSGNFPPGIANKVDVTVKEAVDKAGNLVEGAFGAADKVSDKIFNNFFNIGTLGKKRVCDVFTAVGLAPYLGHARTVQIKNPKSRATSRDQNFFLFPVHRDLIRHSHIRIHYNSKFPVEFGSDVSSATFARDVYLRDSAQASGVDLTPAFRDQIRLLLHDLVHCRQYQALGWSLSKFGLKYLRSYCLAGFRYRTNDVEGEAIHLQSSMDQFLYNYHGKNFFTIWRKHNLFSRLGYPIQKDFTREGDGIRELEFEKGVLQTQGTGCYRYGRKATIEAKKMICEN